MITSRQARSYAVEMTQVALDTIVGAIEREAARKRVQACAERVYHMELARDGRRIWRRWHYWRAQKFKARCKANKYMTTDGLPCPAVRAMHSMMRAKGIGLV